jgi:hypothetical protein
MHLLDEQRHSAGARGDVFDDILRQRMTGGKLCHHVAHLLAVKRRERNRAVMRAHAPRRAELRPRRRQYIERRQRPPFGDAAQHIERGRIGPVQILKCQHHRLRLGPRHHPIGECSQLPPSQFLRRELGRTFFGQRNVDERREQSRILGRVEPDLSQRILQFRKPPLPGHIGGAETLAAPFGDRMKRCVLQQLRATPLDPGVRHIAQPDAEFLDQAGLAESRLADDQHQLSVACPRPVPAPHQHRHFVVTADERRELALPRVASAAARPQEAE